MSVFTSPIAATPHLYDPPPGWSWHKLNTIARLESGHTPSRQRTDWWGGDVSWLSLTEIRALDGTWVASTQLRTNEQGIANSAARVLPKGTVCLSRTASVGYVAIMAKPMATSQDFANWVCGENLDPDFLMYALMCSRSQLREMATGATHKTIYMPLLESLHICAPLVAEQRRIAKCLREQLPEAQRARLACESQAEDIAALRWRVLMETFDAVDDVPRKRLGDHAFTTSGSTPSRNNSAYWTPAEIPWVKTGEIDFEPITKVGECISRTALAECSLALLPPKTVLVAITGEGKTRGRSAVLEVQATTNQHSVSILPNETWDPYFLQLWLQASYHDLRELSEGRGGSRSALSGIQIKALEVPAPPRDVQMALVQQAQAALQEINALADANAAQLDELERLPQRLLAQAFKD